MKTELTEHKQVNPNIFVRMVWMVATEHVYYMTNIALNIHSDMICDISRGKAAQTSQTLDEV